MPTSCIAAVGAPLQDNGFLPWLVEEINQYRQTDRGIGGMLCKCLDPIAVVLVYQCPEVLVDQCPVVLVYQCPVVPVPIQCLDKCLLETIVISRGITEATNCLAGPILCLMGPWGSMGPWAHRACRPRPGPAARRIAVF